MEDQALPTGPLTPYELRTLLAKLAIAQMHTINFESLNKIAGEMIERGD